MLANQTLLRASHRTVKNAKWHTCWQKELIQGSQQWWLIAKHFMLSLKCQFMDVDILKKQVRNLLYFGKKGILDHRWNVDGLLLITGTDISIYHRQKKSWRQYRRYTFWWCQCHSSPVSTYCWESALLAYWSWKRWYEGSFGLNVVQTI